MTPAKIVAIPTINDKNDNPSTKFTVSLNIFPKLKDPSAS